MKTADLKIEGMTCSHCVMSVKQGLAKLPELRVEDVQIGSARVVFDEAKVSETDLAKAIEEAGYSLIP
ncbi:MAG: heavy-metal-associated domain-containing protein [Ignavibacteriales bacterium]|nr:heavy-metal-associated domain-containing protein [Ignavibacteriales bacterium]